jgi:opacity protein-like surface antigen
MKRTLQHILFLAVVTAGGALAQNSDLGILLGASVTHARVSGRNVSANVGGGLQVNYAIQLKETVAGRLYLELPLIVTGAARSNVAAGFVTSSVGATIYLTPGVRWKFTPASRISFYAAAGGGIGSFSGTYVSSSGVPGSVVADVGWKTTGAFGVGGGVDFRVTRLVSFRGEYRDVMTRGNFDGAVHHSLVMIGVGLHF